MILEYNIIRVGSSRLPSLEIDVKTRESLDNRSLKSFSIEGRYHDSFRLTHQILSSFRFKLLIKRIDHSGGWGQNLHVAYQISEDNNSVPTTIPSKIFVTYKHKNIPSKVVSNLRHLNPHYNITFFDDQECASFLRKHYSGQFVSLFRQIPDGPIKSDMVRICFLYIFGGVYYDIDINPYRPISAILKEPGITFCTVRSHNQHNVFQGFIASVPENPILRHCINRFYLNGYSRYKYWGWSGTKQMYRVLVRFLRRHSLSTTIYRRGRQVVKILQEFQTGSSSSRAVRYGETVLFKNKYSDYRHHRWVSGDYNGQVHNRMERYSSRRTLSTMSSATRNTPRKARRDRRKERRRRRRRRKGRRY